MDYDDDDDVHTFVHYTPLNTTHICTLHTFVHYFHANHDQSLINLKTIPAASLMKNPGNVLNIPEEHRIKHDQWCVLSRNHLGAVLQFASESDAQDMLSDTVFAVDEHFVGVALSMNGKLHEVKSVMRTLVAWTEDRVENEGGSPHTFMRRAEF